MEKLKYCLIFSTVFMVTACGENNSGNNKESTIENPTQAVSKIAENIAPISVIQSVNSTINVGDSIVLDGAESTDDGTNTLNYRWTISAKPNNSDPNIGDSRSKTFIFIPDVAGDYQISLIVNDGEKDSQTTTTQIHVLDRQNPQQIDETNPLAPIIESPNLGSNAEELNKTTDLNEIGKETGKVVFRDGFWTGKINVDKSLPNDYSWSLFGLQMENSSTAVIVKDPAGTGENVAKFTVPDDGKSYRAEVQRKQFGWGHYNYSISHYIPSTWPLFDYGTILTQWHGYSLNDKNLNPPIALVLFGKKPEWQLHVYQLKPLTSPLAVPETVLKRYVLDVPVTFNQWNNWNFDITWSQLDENNQLIPGRIIVKYNNVEVANIVGGNNYHQKWPPYFQMGIYRASWKEGALNRPIVGNPIEVYHKGVVIKDMN